MSRAKPAKALAIAVADTGIGIAPEDIPRALERFGQVDSRLSRKYEGVGLGLPLAKQFVELHGGTLTLESALDVGTTVTVTLPSGRDRVAGRIRRHRRGLSVPRLAFFGAPGPISPPGRSGADGASRQPGQVRKEAAVTNSSRVVPGLSLTPKHRLKSRATPPAALL